VIRPFAPEDGEAVAALLSEDEVPHALTADGVRHWLAGQPQRAQARCWVAVVDDRIVAWSRVRLQWFTRAEDVAEVWAFVSPKHRRRGHGRELFAAGLEHVASAGARSVESWSEGGPGARFLGGRGFRPVRIERVLRLDLADADPTGLDELRARKEAEGFTLVPLAAVADRADALYALDAAATADVPATHAVDDFRPEDWAEETLAHPQLTREGSFVLLAGGEPVAYALLHVDPDHGLAANEMTGTRADLRRRGLARLAKLATIAWAGENGYGAILTSTDDANTGMLALNESLGYRPVATGTQFLLDDLS
jgi:RimJ/RimL family protein N-acetyltransferase